ncbi:MAG: recombinase family protein [Candidatus Margulisiibacteriota bacterium]
MKAAIYTRVSTDNQAEVEFNSCEAQELKIKSFIKSQDDIEIHDAYSDQGYSGASLERPSLQRMLYDIEHGLINSVIAYKIDRLTRSPKDFYHLIEIFDNHNVSFISVTERFDTSTPSGRLLRNIMLTFAQFERELISERTRDKMIERAKKGFWHGGPAPYGYKLENKRLIINPDEARIVRTIFKVFIETKSIGKIYDLLKDKKILYRKEQVFSKSEITWILRKGVIYLGKIKFRDNIYDGLHEPIISQKLFDDTQEFKKYRIKRGKAFNNTLFPGMIECKECGSIMSSVFSNKHKKGKQTRYFYYRCSSTYKRDCSACGTRQISADRLEAFIINNLDMMSKNKQFAEDFIFRLNNEKKDTTAGLELQGVRSPQNGFSAENFMKTLENIVKASALAGKYEKREILKRHIEKVIYSKETIEVKILYSESVEPASGPLREPPAEHKFCGDNKDQAACRHLATPPSRLTSTMVCNKKDSPPAGLEPATT